MYYSRKGGALDDAVLIDRAKGGDTGAYELLVTRYQDIAVRTAYVVLGSTSEAEDAAQEAFVRAWHALARFRDGAPFRPWLLQIVANEARNRRKSAGRRERLLLRAAALDPPASEPSPESTMLAGERRDQLLAAVNALRDEDRLVIACRYFLDLSEAETATTLGWPRGTVKSRLSRALGRLRAALATPEQAGEPLRAPAERRVHG